MKTLLQINASLFGSHGNSTRLADRFVAHWRARNPDGRVVVRDLARDPVPHLTAEHVQAFGTPADQRSPTQAALVARSDALIDELKSADVVVLGLPMYNFGVPSVLKSYFDQLARAGVTFRYTANGPEGLIGDRPFYIFAARGGLHRDTPRDAQSGFVTTFLNFIGIDSIEFVYAEGLGISEQSRKQSLSAAEQKIGRLFGAPAVEAIAA